MKIRYLCYSLLAISLICPKPSKQNVKTEVTQVKEEQQTEAKSTYIRSLAASFDVYNANIKSYNEQRAEFQNELEVWLLNPLDISEKKIDQLILNIKAKNNELSQFEEKQKYLKDEEAKAINNGYEFKKVKKKELDLVTAQIKVLTGNITALKNELDEEKKSFNQTEYDTYTRNLAKKEIDLKNLNNQNKEDGENLGTMKKGRDSLMKKLYEFNKKYYIRDTESIYDIIFTRLIGEYKRLLALDPITDIYKLPSNHITNIDVLRDVRTIYVSVQQEQERRMKEHGAAMKYITNMANSSFRQTFDGHSINDGYAVCIFINCNLILSYLLQQVDIMKGHIYNLSKLLQNNIHENPKMIKVIAGRDEIESLKIESIAGYKFFDQINPEEVEKSINSLTEKIDSEDNIKKYKK